MENAAKDILMDENEFKRVFGNLAARFGFERAYGGWFIESCETIIVLDLQKSNFDAHYYLNIKLYVQGLFGNEYRREKKLVKTDVGDVFTRSPIQYSDIFDLQSSIDISDRINRLAQLFSEYIQPIVTLGSTKAGIIELDKTGGLHVLPAVREEIVKLLGNY
jgi:hypothetical protein